VTHACNCKKELARHEQMIQELRDMVLAARIPPAQTFRGEDLPEALRGLKDKPEYNETCWRLLSVMGWEDRLKDIKDAQLREYDLLARNLRGLDKRDLLTACAELSLELIGQL
jgi:hypothetical protein